MSDTVREEFIRKYYNGDAAAYDENMYSEEPEADKRFMKYGHHPTTRWTDIQLHVKCYPQYEELALAWVRLVLGYLPETHAYMPYLAFLQTLVHRGEINEISDMEFAGELLFYVKKIRNVDMKKSGFVLHAVPTEGDIWTYNNYLPMFKQVARDRLSRFLEYEPALEHSMGAEVFLRQIFQNDAFYRNMPFCNADYRSGTIVWYRRIFLEQGEAAADDLDIIKKVPLTAE